MMMMISIILYNHISIHRCRVSSATTRGTPGRRRPSYWGLIIISPTIISPTIGGWRRATCGGRCSICIIWGFEFNITNYNFKQNLNFKTNIKFHPSGNRFVQTSRISFWDYCQIPIWVLAVGRRLVEGDRVARVLAVEGVEQLPPVLFVCLFYVSRLISFGLWCFVLLIRLFRAAATSPFVLTRRGLRSPDGMPFVVLWRPEARDCRVSGSCHQSFFEHSFCSPSDMYVICDVVRLLAYRCSPPPVGAAAM